MYARLIVVVGLTILFAVGCSGASDPISPDNANSERFESTMLPDCYQTTGIDQNRSLIGIWRVRISDDPVSVEVLPMRSVEIHLNAVRLLEVTACQDCLAISNIFVSPPNDVTADLTIRHPYPGLNEFTAFDPRGIFISGYDYTFPESGRNASIGTTTPKMVNADGYTTLYNPTEFPDTLPGPPALKYIPGKFAKGGDLSATLNPYIAYSKDKPRRMLEAGTQETRTVQLYVPSFPIEFGYAVDGCWADPGGPVTDPENDFPPEANCHEAYEINVGMESSMKPHPGSSEQLRVEIFDHQGQDTIQSVTAEAPALFTGTIPLDFSGPTVDGGFLYLGTVTNANGAGVGEYPLLVRTIDTSVDPNIGQIDAWQIYTVKIDTGWTLTWGGDMDDKGVSVAVDDSENSYVGGHFRGEVDFDPGPGEDIRIADDNHDSVFISKFDAEGNHIWTQIWSCGLYDTLRMALVDGLTVDNFGDVYFTGTFRGYVDFDPGPDEDKYTAGANACDMYLCKLDTDGNYQWTRVWGGGEYKKDCTGVATDATEFIYVTGEFENVVDFDPGYGLCNRSSNGDVDSFVTKFKSDGTWLWVETWGGADEDRPEAICTDTLGNIYIAGYFAGEADFDPGSGSDTHYPNGFIDAFLSSLDGSGNYQWAGTWGGDHNDACNNVTVDNSDGIYVTGFFSDTVDFDPGPDEYNKSSHGECDAFLSKFSSDGGFLMARTWGGSSSDMGYGVAVNSSGDVFVTGYFRELVDFDPSTGDDIHNSNAASSDGFLCKYSAVGFYQWVRTWGSADDDMSYSIGADNSQNVYVTGYFFDEVDFDPGDGIELHASNGSSDVYLSKFPPDGYW